MYCGFCGDDAGNHSICPSCGRKVGHQNEPERKEIREKKPSVQRRVPAKTTTQVPKLLVVVLLVIFPIIGLVLVPFSDFDKKTKVGIFVVFGVIFFIFIAFVLMMIPSTVSEYDYATEEVVVEVKEETPSEVSEDAVALPIENFESLSDEKMDMIIEYTVTFDDDDWNGLVTISVNTNMDDTEAMYTYSVLKAIGMSHLKRIDVRDNEYLITTTADNEIAVKVDNDLLVSVEFDGNVLFSVDEGIIDRIDE